MFIMFLSFKCYVPVYYHVYYCKVVQALVQCQRYMLKQMFYYYYSDSLVDIVSLLDINGDSLVDIVSLLDINSDSLVDIVSLLDINSDSLVDMVNLLDIIVTAWWIW